MLRASMVFWSVVVFLGLAARSEAAEVSVEQSEKGAVVKIGGQLFTEYLTASAPKPMLFPILGPTGQPMTEDQARVPRGDHIHHHSLWFTHGSVNGISFWDERQRHGTIQHRKFVRLQGGPEGIIETSNDWIGPEGKKYLEDRRRLVFGMEGEARRIDFDITLAASEGPVVFGDTKEGSMGLRVARSIAVTAKQGGRIVNSEGLVDDKAWGKRAAWVDYFGPVAGETVGIAAMNHPSSFRFPTHWHVRTYGLYCANPFGWKDFQGKDSPDGSYTLEKGKSIELRYRFLFHKGDAQKAKIADAYKRYAGSRAEP